MASKVNTEERRGCTGPGTKEAPGEEMAPWNTSAAGNLPLSEDDRTLHTQGSLSLVNKLVVQCRRHQRLLKIHVL